MSVLLESLFDGTITPGVYQVQPDLSQDVLETVTRLHGWWQGTVELAHATDKPTLLQAFAQTCHFPDYFGYNWDALADCLADLRWIDARGFVLLIHGHESFAQLLPVEWQVTREILEATADFWAEQGTPFVVLL